MRTVSLTARALIDLDQIATYSKRHFGEQQAQIYLTALKAALVKLSAHPFVGPAVNKRARTHRLVFRYHIVFYRIGEDEIVVLKLTDARRRDARHL